MIRNLYIIGFVMGCMGFPVQAKGTSPAPTVPAKTNKTESKTAASTSKDPVKVTVAATAATTKVSAKPASTIVVPASDTTPTTSTASTSAKQAAISRSSSRSTPTTMATSRTSSSSSSHEATAGRLARLTAYWSGEGDYYTGRGMSSTGVHLHNGHCAVDPRIIPYGSVVDIAGVGKYLAVDTGSAVISREAARETGHTPEQRSALVIDIYFESRRDGERFAASATKYANISWSSPRSTASTQDTTSSSVAAE